MKKTVEFSGKKVQEAVDEGLRTLGITLDDADIRIISNGGLFKKAKVEITYDDGLTEEQAKAAEEAAKAEKAKAAEEAAKAAAQQTPPEGEPHWDSAPVKREPTTRGESKKKPNGGERKEPRKEKQPREEKSEGKEHAPKKEREERKSALPTEEQIATAKQFVTELIAHMNIAGEVETSVDEGLRINVNTEDSRIIGHRGEVLDSIQQLVSALINTSHNNFVHITVDGLGYRDRRKESLENLARRMADKAVRTHRKVALEAMNSADRRIIHASLGEREDVFTRSEGHEPARRVVVVPKRK